MREKVSTKEAKNMRESGGRRRRGRGGAYQTGRLAVFALIVIVLVVVLLQLLDLL
jgi:hypothetical protein